MTIDKLKKKMEENTVSRLQKPKTDSMGRVYNKSPGFSPSEIDFFECPEIKELGLELAEIMNREILINFIKNDIVIFRRSAGRRGNKTSYIVTLKTDVRGLVGVDWVYCVEITPAFDNLNTDEKYKSLLLQLTRIPEKTIPSGYLQTYNSFSGLDNILENVNQYLDNRKAFT